MPRKRVRLLRVAALRKVMPPRLSAASVRPAISRHCDWPQNMPPTVRKCSCSLSETWPCALPVHSSHRTSSVAQATRLSTISVSKPCRKVSTRLWKRMPTSLCFAHPTMNTHSSPPRHSSCSKAVRNSLLPVRPHAPTSLRLSASRTSSMCAAMCSKPFSSSISVF